MFIAITIVIGLLIVLFLSLFLRVKIRFRLDYDQDASLFLQLTIANIQIIKYEKKWEDITVDSATDILPFTEKIQLVKNLFNNKLHKEKQTKKMIKHLRRVKVEIVKWETTIGMEDAPITGLLVGSFWSLKGCVIAMHEQFFQLKNLSHIYVHADYNKQVFQSTYECIFSLHLGQAIYTFIKINQSTKVLNG